MSLSFYFNRTEYDEEEKKNDNAILETKYNPQISKEEKHLAKEVCSLCLKLSYWIYVITEPLPTPFTDGDNESDSSDWDYKRIVPCKDTQILQYAILKHNKAPQHLYLTFKGTDPDKIMDTIADTGMIPIPIFCDKKDVSYWDFAVHSGIHSSLMRDFHDIWRIINKEHSFETLIITGHSLGAGISILFALQTIIHKYLPSNKRMIIIAFAAPSVISYHKPFNKLSKRSQLILSELHDICHCFVNKFDPLPRLPTRPEWLMTVIPYGMRKAIKEKMTSNSFVPFMWSTLIDHGAHSAHLQFVKTMCKYMDILASYHPFGTYYFCTNQRDQPLITKNPKAIEKILGFIPPHKIIDSSGNSLRVCHFASKIEGIEDKRFSSRYLRDLIRIIDIEKEKEKEKEKGNNDEESISMKSESLTFIKDLSLINLLTIENDYDGDWNRDLCIYKVMESNDEQIMKKIIAKRKLTPKNWLQLVNDHCMDGDGYNALFENIHIESLSLGYYPHLAKIEAELKDQNMPRLKKTTSKMYNKIKEMRRMSFSRRVSFSRRLSFSKK